MHTPKGNLYSIPSKYYISPVSGRTIKSTGKTYQILRKNKFEINKHRCLYNIDSAKRCLKQILTRYANVYPPSSFVNIPLTLSRNNELDYIRAFIKDKDRLKGFITKDGSLYKFKRSIQFDKKKKYPVIKYASKKDRIQLINRLDLEGKVVSKKMQKKVNKYLYDIRPRCDTINILYNSLQNDFIPINGKVNKKELLKDVNDMLIPKKLEGILKTDISGILISAKDKNNIIGYVDNNNIVKKFEKPIEVKFEKTRHKEKTDTGVLSEIDLPSELEFPGDFESIKMSEMTFKALPKVIDYIDDTEKGGLLVTQIDTSDFIKQFEKICKEDKKCIMNYCKNYDLKWDEKYKKCKKIRKIVSKTKSLEIIVDNRGNIVGYT